jgi:O-antigen ligase
MRDLTGRTRAWANAWKLLAADPFLGWGPQSDRYLIREHVHNTYLYAWMTAGVLGVLAFAGGLVFAWRDLVVALRRRSLLPTSEQTLLVIVSAIVVLFTVRSIPEVSGAMFGIDFLVFAPAVAYLGVTAANLRDLEEGPA